MKTMKRMMAVLLSIVALLTLSTSVSAQTSEMSVSVSADHLTVGQTFTCTVTMEKTTASSLGVEILCPEGVEVVSGQWLISGLMASFDMTKNKGVFSPGGATELEGAVFALTLQAVSPSVETKDLGVRLIAKNGTQTVFDVTYTQDIRISCVTHTWDEGTVTTEPSCTEQGTKTYHCTACGEQKNQVLDAAGHTPSEWITDQEPAPGVPGSRHVECTVCHAVLDTEDIPALETQTYEAQIGQIQYTTLIQAMAAAKSGDTVKLLTAASMDDVMVKTGVTLDLNGNVLTAQYLVSFSEGAVVDSAAGEGLMQCANVRLNPDNPAMPLWDAAADGYRFFALKSQQKYSKQTESGFVFIAKPLPIGGTGSALMAKSETNGLRVSVRMRWSTASGNQVTQLFSMKESDVKTVYANSNKVIQLTVSGAGVYAGKMQTTAYIESETGVIWTGNDILYVGE